VDKMIRVKRIYDEHSNEDGFRILVDRFWPRGISKEKGKIDLWYKEISPSNELRKWYNHDGNKWNEFIAKYEKEILSNEENLIEFISLIKKHNDVTFLFSSKNLEINNAEALKLIIAKYIDG
jgi:uncharacterized protein YeaO (DUF488 family)